MMRTIFPIPFRLDLTDSSLIDLDLSAGLKWKNCFRIYLKTAAVVAFRRAMR